jgi:acyl carrier protein
MPDEETLRRAVLEVLKQVAPEMNTTALDPNRSFRDQMGLDSIDFLNFVLGLEERLGMRIAETDYPQLSCLRGCLSYMEQHPAPAAS